MARFRTYFAVPLILWSSLLFAEGSEKAEVLLIGTFHFANPGLDVVKTNVIDVLSDDSQAYLEAVTQRIAELKPTAVLLEYDPKEQAEVLSEFKDYRDGHFKLPRNEIYQLGFRIAKKAGLKEVHPFDEQDVHWQAERLFERLEREPLIKVKMDTLIAEVTSSTNDRHASLTLGPLLRTYNQAEEDQLNRSFYIMTNSVEAGNGFAGADAAASWWHRNFRMYARVQHHAPVGGDSPSRVVVIGGQGHTAILRQLLADDPDRSAIDPLSVL
ncbi:MAG: DUF5694 domain-containing protein [Pseudomonadota bacterium]